MRNWPEAPEQGTNGAQYSRIQPFVKPRAQVGELLSSIFCPAMEECDNLATRETRALETSDVKGNGHLAA